MGVEYKLTCAPVPKDLDAKLRAVPGFSEYEPQYEKYHFRAAGNRDTSKMPDAGAGIESDGIYFVGYGNQALADGVLRHLIRLALAEADEVTIKEL